MKTSRWQWIGLILLCFLLVTIGCGAKKAQVKTEAEGEPGQPAATGPVAEMAPSPSAPESPQPPALPERTGPTTTPEPPGSRSYAQRPERPAVPPGPPTAPPSTAFPSPSAPSYSPVSPTTGGPGSPMRGAAPAAPGAPGRGNGFVLNFDNADLYEVVRMIADILKINFIIDQKVRGTVTIHSAGPIYRDDIWPIFQTILKMNGATAVKKGVLYEIIPFADAKKTFTPPVATKEMGKKLVEERYSIQIIPLKYIPVAEVSKMLKPFLSDGADIVEHPLNNVIIIGDMASNVQKVLDIVDLFDVDIFVDQRIRIYPIVNSDVNEITKEMEKIFASFEISTKSGRGVGITFTPITRINSLLVISSIPDIFGKVERWLKELDRVPAEGTKLSVFVYYVQNGKAKDLADVLKQVYQPGKEKKEFREKVVTPEPAASPRSVRPPPTPTQPATPAQPQAAPRAESPGTTGGVPEGELNIVVDEVTNALIIRAYSRDYLAVLDTIKKLDLYPKQVLIEVLLAEVTLTDLTKYGLEYSYFRDSWVSGGRTYPYQVSAGGTSFIGDAATGLPIGLRYAVTATDKLVAAVHASASENRLNVISSPHILASNNKEAKIQIGSSQPILTNTYTTGSTSTTGTGVVEGTIEYKDIGIILTVTPRISDSKLVTLEISIEDSKVSTTTLGTLPSIPVFKKKTAKTTLSVMEGQMIVIGGLIEESKDTSKTGIPYLSKIPILGALFGLHTYDVGKTETVLMLTPRVITDIQESNLVTLEFQEKIQAIKKELEKKKKKDSAASSLPKMPEPRREPQSQ